MEPTPLEIEMSRRIRRHMLTATAGALAGFTIVALGGTLGEAVSGDPGSLWATTFPVLGLLVIPLVGFWSTFHYLRCPSCGGLVAFQVSARYSAFGATARQTCRHCAVKIFADRKAQSIRVVFVMIAVLAALVVLGALGALLTPRP